MRKSTGNTPTTKKGQKNVQTADTSEKKLVQARLPFKIIAAGTPPSSGAVAGEQDERADGTSTTDPARQDVRKRKLSYETEEKDESVDDLSKSKENLEVTSKKPKLSTVAATEAIDDVVLLLDDEDDSEQSQGDKREPKPSQTSLRKTPKGSGKTVKGAGSPQDTNSTQDKGSACKVLIKLPLSGGKNKRRKTKRKSTTRVENLDNQKEEENIECSDDIEHMAEELNPQKRLKLEGIKKRNAQKNAKVLEIIDLESDTDEEEPKKIDKSSMPDVPKKSAVKSTSSSNESSEVDTERAKNSRVIMNASRKEKVGDDDVTDEDSVAATADSEDSHVSSDAICNIENPEEQCKPDESKPSALKDSKVVTDQKKPLTPKQIKLNEQRRKVREEKERKLQEEREQKQREKDEKELERKREREEREEQRRKEREEKDELKRKERDEKERKRLAEIEVKNDEKRRRNEAKEEELRKKEDERKRKEQEKEEAQLKKKKAAEGFKKFFVPKESRASMGAELEQSMHEGGNASAASTLAFRPFQIKGDMALAPIRRKLLTAVKREKLEAVMCAQTEKVLPLLPQTQLYLSELKTGLIAPGKWRKPVMDTKADDDVCIVEDELERAGQAIVEETHGPVEHFRAKFFKFHENRRPAFYGTWRKQTSVVTARRPLAQDTKYFDYEVDSDLEWEEEEPGESLDGSDDEKEKESEDDEYEVDNEWFVPHGHLSDEELQNEDECGIGEDNDREAQKAKLKLLQQEFAQEMKKKTEKIKPRLLGCIWVDENGNQPDLCPKIIWDTLSVHAMLYTATPLVAQPEELADKSEPGSPSTGNGNGVEKTAEKLKPVVLSEQMLKQLVRLVHGNRNSKVFLIKEFIAYVEANEDAIKNGDARGPLKSMVREKIDEYAEWQITESQNNSKKKKSNKKCLCWVISDDVLQRMHLEDLSLRNKWQYTLQPKFTNAAEEHTTQTVSIVDEEPAKADVQDTTGKDAARTVEITKFTKKLTAVEKAQQLQQSKSASKNTIPRKRSGAVTEKAVTDAAAEPPTKKRVALLMSVPRGEQFPATTKNALISQFLTKHTTEAKKPLGKATHKSSSAAAIAQAKEQHVIVLD